MSFPRRQGSLCDHIQRVLRPVGCENTARHVWGGDYTYIQALTPRTRNASANPGGLCAVTCRCNFCRFAAGLGRASACHPSSRRQTELARTSAILHTSFGQPHPRPCAALHPHPSGMHAPQILLAFVGKIFSGQNLTLSTSFVL